MLLNVLRDFLGTVPVEYAILEYVFGTYILTQLISEVFNLLRSFASVGKPNSRA